MILTVYIFFRHSISSHQSVDDVRDESRTIKLLTALAKVPTHPSELESWLTLDGSLRFLTENAASDSIALYVSAGHIFIHSALVSSSNVSPPDFTDILKWHCDPFSSWSFSISQDGVNIVPPFSYAGCKTLDGAEQLVFIRNFEGVAERRNYIDLPQRLVHLFGLHYMPDRKAWCRLDRFGDLEDVIRVADVPEENARSMGRAVLCSRDVLSQYAALTKTTLVRLFDFTCTPDQFGGWHSQREDIRAEGSNIRYRYGRMPSASYGRGAQIIPIAASLKAVLDSAWGNDPAKKYVSFISQDWKHNCISEISCDPDELGSYFTESDKPFETTPAFFRPEVLLKYKADREKYDLGHRSVGCRGSWHLQSFDINEEGQVHTYLVYLGRLPYEEQLHWKQYNEAPKGPISRRAYATDFEGSWDEHYDPLMSLKRKLQQLVLSNVTWWKLRGEELIDRAYYPVTTSRDEWAEEILNLDQLLVEGFDEKRLRVMCIDLGANPDSKWRSLSLVEACLIASGYEVEHAKSLVSPLRKLHELRSKVKGHATEKSKALRHEAISKYGSLGKHYWALAQACDEAMKIVISALGEQI